jgi:FMN phosphatase YigB (HAD superfamily)
VTAVGAVLFDFGNTLFAHDSLPTTIARLAGELGRTLEPELAARLATEIDAAAHTPDELLRPRDLDAAVWQARWAILYGRVDEEVPGLGPALLADMHDPARWLPFAETATVLRGLHATGVRIGVVSNTGWDIRTAFAHHGFANLVDVFALSYEVRCTKPDTRIFIGACESLGAEPAATMMVGDDPLADSGAVAAGLRVLLLPPTPPGTDNGLTMVLDLL